MALYFFDGIEAPKVDSFLITIFDATTSMWLEYDIAIDEYKKCFSQRLNKKEFYMTHQCSEKFIEMKGLTGGNITNAFLTVLTDIKNKR